jgi:hypothetical protein
MAKLSLGADQSADLLPEGDPRRGRVGARVRYLIYHGRHFRVAQAGLLGPTV